MNHPVNQPQAAAFLRLPEVLARFPISRSGWLRGVREGRYPEPVRLSPRTVFWRAADIDALIKTLAA